MSMTIGTNVHSLVAQRSLHESGKMMSQAMERLATGKQINSGADDAAGLAMTSRMAGTIAGLEAAGKNITDGIALTEAIEGSLVEVNDMLQRMRTISVQAASDTISDTDRVTLNNELTSLKNEMDALSTRVTFNGQNVLDGSYTSKLIQVGDTANETISVSQTSIAPSVLGAFTISPSTAANQFIEADTGADATAALAATRVNDASFTITGNGTTTGAIGDAAADTAKSVAAEVNALTGTTGVSATAITEAEFIFSNNTQAISLNGVAIAGFGVGTDAAVLQAINAQTSSTGITAIAASGTRTFKLTASDGSDITVQNRDATATLKVRVLNADGTTTNRTQKTISTSGGANEFAHISGRVTLTSDAEFSVTETAGTNGSYANTGTATSSLLSNAVLTSQSNANTAISVIDGALSKVATMRADLGAITKRLEHAFDSALAMRDATDNAMSKLVDADMADESANLAKAQVLQQVGTAMLAQANAAPQLVLQLLQ